LIIQQQQHAHARAHTYTHTHTHTHTQLTGSNLNIIFGSPNNITSFLVWDTKHVGATVNIVMLDTGLTNMGPKNLKQVTNIP